MGTLLDVLAVMREPQFDVLAVRGDIETLHVVPRGTVPDGTRTDVITGHQVVRIGQVSAPDDDVALAIAMARYPDADQEIA
jgi:hypothetical protein